MPRTTSGRDATLPALAEAFREHGYEGASLAELSKATGLGKGSLYNFFPGGKDEMAAAVLADIDGWFEADIFAPLRAGGPDGIDRMLDGVTGYFRSGRRVCLQGAFALGNERDRFAEAIQGYFERWIASLSDALRASGRSESDARTDAVDTVARIQGAIVLSRALGDPALFSEVVRRARATLVAGRATDQSTTSTSFQNAT